MLSSMKLWEVEDFHCLWFNTSVWSVLKQHSTLFLTHNRDTSVMDKVCCKWVKVSRKTARPERRQALLYSNGVNFLTKTMRAGEQWWGTWWVIPKCMSQMSSPEWLGWPLALKKSWRTWLLAETCPSDSLPPHRCCTLCPTLTHWELCDHWHWAAGFLVSTLKTALVYNG